MAVARKGTLTWCHVMVVGCRDDDSVRKGGEGGEGRRNECGHLCGGEGDAVGDRDSVGRNLLRHLFGHLGSIGSSSVANPILY